MVFARLGFGYIAAAVAVVALAAEAVAAVVQATSAGLHPSVAAAVGCVTVAAVTGLSSNNCAYSVPVFVRNRVLIQTAFALPVAMPVVTDSIAVSAAERPPDWPSTPALLYQVQHVPL